MSGKRDVLFVLLATTLGLARPGPACGEETLLLDDFEHLSGWTVHPADGVEAEIRPGEGRAGAGMRIDFHFRKGGGYAVVHKTFPTDLPENYFFSFSLRGEAPDNHLEFKLIDESGENVWWSVQRDLRFPREWETVRIKKRQIRFAWGPLGGGEIRKLHAIEIAITAGSGGSGTVWIDDLAMRPLPPPNSTPPEPVATASSSLPGHEPASVLEADPALWWRSAARDSEPWIGLDLGGHREYGGLVVHWMPGFHATDYDVEISDDGSIWRTVREVRRSNGGRDDLFLPETESSFLRLRVSRQANRDGVAARGLEIRPLEWAPTKTAFFQAIAAEEPRGTFPRGMWGEAVYWTVVGVDGGAWEGLLSEDGSIEAGRGSFSLEPFLLLDGRLYGWSDVEAGQSLLDGRLPLPSVRWRAGSLVLHITAFASGSREEPLLVARYRLTNEDSVSRDAALCLALRPFQVNPPWQFLGRPGGMAEIDSMECDGRSVWVNGSRRLLLLHPGAAFGALAFDEGDVVRDYLQKRAGSLPPAQKVSDPFGAASGALAYSFRLEPGESGEVDLLFLPEGNVRIGELDVEEEPSAWVGERLEQVSCGWREKLRRTTISLPPQAEEIERAFYAQLAYILVNRSGPALRPGARAYARSWIRDGALTSSALLRLGHAEPVREFIEWYAPYQYENGKIPCVVDDRGADPVPEHDSSGEFIFLVAEYARYAKDENLLRRMWPAVARAADYLDSLRHERRTDEYRKGENALYFGLLPPSISHEGYSAKPMHSYWDDLWAWRGFRDAAWMAGVLGLEEERARWRSAMLEFQSEWVASLHRVMEHHQIDYMPGCADLGDFDPTSTTIALGPIGADSFLPRGALERTFDRYYRFFVERRDTGDWEVYTPYEVRNIGALVRLGRREEAQELFGFFLSHRRPAGWEEWAEVVRKDARAPGFIGDMPHTWVGSDFIRSVLDMLLYHDEKKDALVLGAGIPEEWLSDPEGVQVRDLPTPFGSIDYTMRRQERGLEVRIRGDLAIPSGGVELRLPGIGEAARVTIDGKAVTPEEGGGILVRNVPAVVLLSP